MVLIGDLILTEVLQGFRTERQAADALAALARFLSSRSPDPRSAVAAALNSRRLRTLGITVRKTIDTIH